MLISLDLLLIAGAIIEDSTGEMSAKENSTAAAANSGPIIYLLECSGQSDPD